MHRPTYHAEYPATLEPIERECGLNIPARPYERAMTDAAIERHQARLGGNIFIGFLDLFDFAEIKLKA